MAVSTPIYNAYTGATYILLGANLGNPDRDLYLSNADYRLDGVNAVDNSGNAVSSAGDMDDDGYDDVLIGAYRVTNSSGLISGGAYVVLGSSLQGSLSAVSLSTADYVFEGEGNNQYFGIELAQVGDVDADGLTDLFFGAPANSSYADDGIGAYLVLTGNLTGPGTYDMATEADFLFNAPGGGTYNAGSTVAGLGDTNDDGLDDLIVGAPDYLQFTGQAYILQSR